MSFGDKKEVILPERPVFTFYMRESTSEDVYANTEGLENVDNMPIEPEVHLGSAKINSSGLILLSPVETLRYFMFLDRMIFRIQTGVSVRIPKGYVANIQPIDYTYNNRFILPKTINTVLRSEHQRIVVDMLITKDSSDIEIVIEKDVPIACLFFTRICDFMEI